MRFIERLRCPGVAIEVGTMSTRISGDSKEVFDALQDAFVRLGERHQIVLTVKASNACPEDEAPEQDRKRHSRAGEKVPGSDRDMRDSIRRK